MDFSEKWGKDTNEAVNLALQDLKLSIEEVEITILEEPSKGFLGIGSKLAKVRVEKKFGKKEDKREEEMASKEISHEKIEIGKTKDLRKQKTDKPQEKKELYGVLENQEDKKKRELRGRKTKNSNTISRPDDLVPLEEHEAIDFLRETTKKMNLELKITAAANEENIYIDIEGQDAGTIIGKRGQTLDAIQYLTSLVVNKDRDKYFRVVVDAENYRTKREQTLELLAERLANKVIKTGRSVKLEPMNPYERMVIHASLHDDPQVMTKSEGEEPYRRVIIDLK